jgi:uncharacterized BrkB/YihY/UPF0761 family membrane protein
MKPYFSNIVKIRVVQSFVICIITFYLLYQFNPEVNLNWQDLSLITIFAVVLTLLYYQLTMKNTQFIIPQCG